MNHPFLIELSKELQENIAFAEEIIAGKSEQQLFWKPQPNIWSICECYGHLLQTHYQYLPKLQQAIEKGHRTNAVSDVPYKATWFGKRFIDYVGPESTATIKAPSIFRPKKERQQDVTVCRELIKEMGLLQQLIASADGLNLNKNKLVSPVTRLIRFTLGEGLQLQVKHQQRHLNQAERVASHDTFPPA